ELLAQWNPGLRRRAGHDLVPVRRAQRARGAVAGVPAHVGLHVPAAGGAAVAERVRGGVRGRVTVVSRIDVETPAGPALRRRAGETTRPGAAPTGARRVEDPRPNGWRDRIAGGLHDQEPEGTPERAATMGLRTEQPRRRNGGPCSSSSRGGPEDGS